MTRDNLRHAQQAGKFVLAFTLVLPWFLLSLLSRGQKAKYAMNVRKYFPRRLASQPSAIIN